ncbi:MAG: zinc ABC transporter substrate-binding protein [Caldilineaceae bacterium]|nr:zinc ABC transporter substrate-binding protein [Caldilineaceae bacterium]
MNRIHHLVLAILLVSVIAGCSNSTSAATASDDRPRVVTTIGMLTDIVQIVGGEHIRVRGLMGAGVDPHLYVASEGDVEALQNADIIFYNGLFLEAQMDSILKQLGERKRVVAVGETIDEGLLLPWAAYADEYDPHIWFDVQLWMKAVEAVRDTLVEADSANAEQYRSNAARYLQELAELDAYVKAEAARLPAEQRVLITAHDAFHYFGRAYGFDVRGLQGISTASEAGAADVRSLADFITERQIHAIFVESSVPVRNVEALQAAVRSRGRDVVIGGELFSDAMGNPGTPEGTYVGMVRHNIDTIVGALLGQSTD